MAERDIMRSVVTTVWLLFWLAVLGAAAWVLGLGSIVHASVTAGHLLDWLMGGLCLLWLIVILKVPWDLYFQAHGVAFELERARERGIATPDGREAYVRVLRRKLAWIAVGAHWLSAALVAAIAYFSHGMLGYYFAAFYIVSTVFRPAVAAYMYLSRKLAIIGEEAHYPREDVVEMRSRLQWHDQTLNTVTAQMEQYGEELRREKSGREEADREMRQRIQAISREFESTVSRLTDNQEVINGIQAFVRLVAQSTQG